VLAQVQEASDGGKTSTATRLNTKIVEMAYAISVSVARTMPDTAAIADAPQMPVADTDQRTQAAPTTASSLQSTTAPISATASVPSMTGSDLAPIRITCREGEAGT